MEGPRSKPEQNQEWPGMMCYLPGKATAMACVTGRGTEAEGQGSLPGRLENPLKVFF